MVDSSILEEETAAFIAGLNIDSQYDYTVAIEHKGLAVFRMLRNRANQNELRFSKTKLISEEALDFVSRDFFTDKRFLVLDDSVFSGKMLRAITQKLKNNGAKVVESACVIAHRNPDIIPTWVLYPNLSILNYGRLREQLINHLSEHDFLFIDSEHIPIKLRTNMVRDQFLQLLRRLDPLLVVPRSIDTEKIYVTIHQPRYFDLTHLELQPGSILNNVVLKLRLVVADYEAWLIPLVYPSIPVDASEITCPLHREEPAACVCTKTNMQHDPSSFYCQSLYTGINLFARTFALLNKLSNQTCQIEEMPFEGLNTLFPAMDTEAFRNWATKVIESEVDTCEFPDYFGEGPFPVENNSDLVREAAFSILRLLSEQATKAEQDHTESVNSGFIPAEELAIPNADLIYSSNHRQLFRNSCALDSLIDQALVAAMPMRLYDEKAKGYWVRGMRLSGEYVRNLVRQAL